MNFDTLQQVLTDPGFADGYFSAMFMHIDETIRAVFGSLF